MHSIDNVMYTLLNMIHAVPYWVGRYNGCVKNLITVCGVIISSALLPGNMVYLILLVENYLEMKCSFMSLRFNT